MDGKKVYQIQINGITESANAVETLNKQLDALSARIKALENSNVKVSAGGGGNASALSEEEAIQREINKLKKEGETLDAKIAASQDEIYKRVDATKQLYKETIADQKAMAAQERLTADAYSNTMQGMKSHLADLKAAINVTDLGDSDKIKKMTQEANELTNKLKEMEQAYGQFGRNVGNYASAADGFKGLVVQIGDATKEFDNAKQALKELKKERDTLSTKKDMGLISEEEAKRLQDLIPTVAQLQSSIQDAGKPMDELMDSMQSFVAVMQTTKGLSAFFGVDNTEVEKTIKNLVALQNAMQGLQTIQKQIQTREGIGGWIAPFTVQIDKATASLLRFNTALLGTGKAANVAAKGIKMVGTAMKALVSIGIIAIISVVVDKVMDLIESFNKLSAAEEAQKDAEEAMSKAYGEGMAKITQYKVKLDSFNGSKKEEKKLVEELNKEFGETLGTYKSIAEWQDVMKKKSDLYVQSLVKQAKAQAALNAVTAAYAKLMQVQLGIANGEFDGIWNKIFGKSGEARLVEAEREVEQMTKMLEDSQKELEQFNKENKLGDYAPQIKKNTAKTKNAVEDAQKTLNQLELRLMQEGLNKKLRQLDEEERQTINKLKENGTKSSAVIKRIQRAYAELRAKEIRDYLKALEDSIRNTAKDINNIKFEINTSEIENQLNALQNKFNELSDNVPLNKTLVTRVDLNTILGGTSMKDYLIANFYKEILDKKKFGKMNEYYRSLYNYIKNKNKEIQDKFNELYESTIGTDAEKKAAQYKFAEKVFEEELKDAITIVRDYGNRLTDYWEVYGINMENVLSNSFEERLRTASSYYDSSIKQLEENIKKQSELNKKRINDQYEQDSEAEKERFKLQVSGLTQQKDALEESIKNFKARNDEEVKEFERLKQDRAKIEKQIEDARKLHGEKMGQLEDVMTNDIKKTEYQTLKDIQSAYERYYSIQLSNYRDFQSKLNDEISRNPVANSWNIINIGETRKNYEEIMAASKTALGSIIDDKNKLAKDFKNGLISKESYNTTLSTLNDLEKEIKNGMQTTAEASNNLLASFQQSINTYIQAGLQAVQDVMGFLADYQDYVYEKEQDALDKENDMLQEKLDEQQDIVEKHKDAIDSIEDELATARGDRRQHLIDQLNAEMAAQRAAQAEEKKIQKQKEAAEKKQEELDKKRKQAEYKRNLLSILVSTAMATANGLATQPFVPVGIAMGSLATTLGMVQYALAAKAKPYAKGGQLDGGVAQGARHSQGGIKVLGGRAEIEGGEFITNRKSTANNIDLLEYINSKKTRVDLSDLLEFYNGNTIRKNIRSVRTKFEDGGYVPTLPNELDIRDQLQNIVVNQDNRPVVVSVVDINNKQDDVRRVQTLAGL